MTGSSNAFLSSEEVLTAFYRIILGRDPDPSGLSDHIGLLEDPVAPASIESLLNAFVHSREGVARLAPQLFYAISDGATVTGTGAKRQSADHFISLGGHCITSGILKTTGHKSWSGPLDWVFSSPEMAIHCLRDGFATFLDPAQFDAIPIEARPAADHGYCNHRLYRDTFGVHMVFNHRDPLVPENYDYYWRAAARLMAILPNHERKLLVCITSPEHLTENHFDDLSRTIAEIGRNCELLGFRVHEPHRRAETSGLSLNTAMTRGDDRLIDFNTAGLMGPVSFHKALDTVLVAAVLEEYS